MKVTVKLFASLKDEVGEDELVVDVPEGATVNELLGTIAEDHPDVGRPEMVVALDREVVDRDRTVDPDAEIAVYPPVSGGAVIRDALSLDDALDNVRTDGTGAVVTFTGVVRGHSRGRDVETLEYEAYDEMADESMADLVDRAEDRFDIERALVAHRQGTFEVGEPVVWIAVAAAHREPAFEACSWLIDTLKVETPIWKKERTTDGEEWVTDHA